MRTLSIEQDGVKVVDHRGYIDMEINCIPGKYDRFETFKCNRGFTVRWIRESEDTWWDFPMAWFHRINSVNNFTEARVLEGKQ